MFYPRMSNGSKVGPWTLHEKLGSGGNATVWRTGGEDAALKVINTTKTQREPYRRVVPGTGRLTTCALDGPVQLRAPSMFRSPGGPLDRRCSTERDRLRCGESSPAPRLIATASWVSVSGDYPSCYIWFVLFRRAIPDTIWKMRSIARETKEKCPACGSDDVVPLVFGYRSEPSNGDVVHGGCLSHGDERDPQLACRTCGLWFGAVMQLPTEPQ
jgi:hypothetical protein